ncbi:MAG: hypothetical protein NT129_00735 [Candidatus Aenigmarchaeota archaeon]|nr:hypothetical protein [Candidatus Aenigmarchaeota archaeon]
MEKKIRCQKCGYENPEAILSSSGHCEKCEASLPSLYEEKKEDQVKKLGIKKPIKWWYLYPIFFGIFGGIYGYYFLKDMNKKFAKKILYLGIIVSALPLILSLHYMFVCTSHSVAIDSVSSENDTYTCKSLCYQKFNVTSYNIVTITERVPDILNSSSFVNLSTYLCFCDLNDCKPK